MTVFSQKRILAALASLLLVLPAGGAYASGIGVSHSRAAGMGMAYTALANGIHAPAWNPANLAGKGAPRLDIGLVGVGTQIGNDGVSYGDFVDWMADEVLTTAEIQEAVDMFPGGSLSIHTNTEITSTPLSLVVGRFAFNYGFTFISEVGLPRGVVDAISDSRTHAEQYQAATGTGLVRDMSGLKGDIWLFGTAGFSYAQLIDVPALDRFAIGGTFNVYLASPRFRVVESMGDIIIRGNTIESTTARAVVELAGGTIDRVEEIEWQNGIADTSMTFKEDIGQIAAWGLGLTLGAAGTWNEMWDFSVAIHNIPLRPITWSEGERRTFSLNTSNRLINARSLFDDKPDDMETVDYLDTLFAAPGSNVEEYEQLDEVKAYVPVILRAGVARTFFDNKLTWVFDWEQGFTNTAISSTTPRISTGAEYRPIGKWIPIRAGMSIGGRTGHFASLGIGFNLGPFSWDIAMINEGAFTPFEVPFASRAKGIGFSTQMRLTF